MGEQRSAEFGVTIPRVDRPVEEDPAYEPDTVVDRRYRLLRRIGEGGMGRVYEAEHLELGRRVAVKVMRKKYADQRAMVERFRVEARSASKIGHPNIVQVFDFGTTDAGEGFIVMELLNGVPLSDVIKVEGPLELPRMLAILSEVATALRAAHDAGVVHRDLKPANIFLIRVAADERERVRVLDFGMAKLVDGHFAAGTSGNELSAANEILGTPEYMSPEQAVGGEVDRRADIYAFGCVAYEMWTGAPPFSGSSYVTVLAKHMDEKAPRPSDMRDTPPSFDQLVARALAKSPDDRPADMRAVLKALQRIAEQEGVPLARRSGTALPALPKTTTPAPRPSPERTSLRRGFSGMKRRSRRNVQLVAGALACAVAGAAAMYRFGPAPSHGPATLVVATSPAGATIKVDGRELEERAPAVLRVAAGPHDVEAVMPHFLKKEAKGFSLAPSATEILRLPLVRDVYKLSVTSEPAGATAYLDGFSVGTTPLEIDVNPWDPHTLRLERLGRRAWEKYLPPGERPKLLSAVLKKVEGGDEK